MDCQNINSSDPTIPFVNTDEAIQKRTETTEELPEEQEEEEEGPSTSNQGSSCDENRPPHGEEEPETEELITIPVPVTSKTQSQCVVCRKTRKKQCINVPTKARLQVHIADDTC